MAKLTRMDSNRILSASKCKVRMVTMPHYNAWSEHEAAPGLAAYRRRGCKGAASPRKSRSPSFYPERRAGFPANYSQYARDRAAKGDRCRGRYLLNCRGGGCRTVREHPVRPDRCLHSGLANRLEHRRPYYGGPSVFSVFHPAAACSSRPRERLHVQRFVRVLANVGLSRRVCPC